MLWAHLLSLLLVLISNMVMNLMWPAPLSGSDILWLYLCVWTEEGLGMFKLCLGTHPHGLDICIGLSSSFPRPLGWDSGGFLAHGLAGEDLSHCDADRLDGAEQGRENLSAHAQLWHCQSPGFHTCCAPSTLVSGSREQLCTPAELTL